jgi:DNA repair protein RadA
MKKDQKNKLEKDFIEILTPSEYQKLTGENTNVSHQYILNKRRKNGILTNELYDNQQNHLKPSKYSKKITLNSENFNLLLGNGFFPAKFYLLYGKFATAKTQICHNICVSLQNENKNLKKPVQTLYIDTEDTFRPERILEIAIDGYNLNGNDVLKRVNVLKAKTLDLILTYLNKITREGLDKQTKVIIIDSLTKPLRIEIGDKEKSIYKVRIKFKKILQLLSDLKDKYNVFIIVTSQVTSIFSKTTGFNIKPVGEYLLNEYIEESILLSKNEIGKRFAYLINSCFLPENVMEFVITGSGIKDPIS